MYVPPRPTPLAPLAALARTVLGGQGDLLSLLPAAAYRFDVGHLGWSRRAILLVNQPELVRGIMADPQGIFPKNDLMTGALEPLVGDAMFVSSGDTWRRQRRLIDPAFSHMHITRAFASMTVGVDDWESELDGRAASGEPFSLDLAMSHLTADIICRTVFSTSLQSQAAREVFEDFSLFERSVAHVSLKALIFDPPFRHYEQQPAVLDACARIRHHLGELVDSHLNAEADAYDDIAAHLIRARDPGADTGFTRRELIDQLGVFFLAGHETTASALTWAFFILSQQPAVVEDIRREVAAVAGEGPITFEHQRALALVRSVFRETLRLYPPLTFIPRVAAQDTRIGRFRVRRGTMVMIAPWVMHRHRRLWKQPDGFDPGRFLPGREDELPSGAYLPFGAGPRVCVGATFALTEATLILARLLRRYDWHVQAPRRVRPAARMTTRPVEQVYCTVSRR